MEETIADRCPAGYTDSPGALEDWVLWVDIETYHDLWADRRMPGPEPTLDGFDVRVLDYVQDEQAVTFRPPEPTHLPTSAQFHFLYCVCYVFIRAYLYATYVQKYSDY